METIFLRVLHDPTYSQFGLLFYTGQGIKQRQLILQVTYSFELSHMTFHIFPVLFSFTTSCIVRLFKVVSTTLVLFLHLAHHFILISYEVNETSDRFTAILKLVDCIQVTFLPLTPLFSIMCMFIYPQGDCKVKGSQPEQSWLPVSHWGGQQQEPRGPTRT